MGGGDMKKQPRQNQPLARAASDLTAVRAALQDISAAVSASVESSKATNVQIAQLMQRIHTVADRTEAKTGFGDVAKALIGGDPANKTSVRENLERIADSIERIEKTISDALATSASK
jgi:phage shock protein A